MLMAPNTGGSFLRILCFCCFLSLGGPSVIPGHGSDYLPESSAGKESLPLLSMDNVPRFSYRKTLVLSGSVQPGASVRVEGDPMGGAESASIAKGRWRHEARLRSGINKFTVTARDNAGNLSQLTTQTTLRHALLIAHKGSSHAAPENTLAAFNLAWQQGADLIELDVQHSKDRRLMVLHNATTGATAGTNLVVKDNYASVLRSLDVSSGKGRQYAGARIPFLEEAIATVPAGKKIMVELKTGPEVLPALQRVITESGKERQLIVYATDQAGLVVLAELRKLMPNLTLFYSVTSVADEQQLVKTAVQHGLNGLSVNYKLLTPSLIAVAKEAKLQIFAWTVDDWLVVKTLLELGIDGYLTNWPDIMLYNLRKIGVMD